MSAYLGYLYAADKLDRLVRTRYQVEWKEIIGDRDAHSSSNAIRLMRRGAVLRGLNDLQVSKQLDLIRYIFWAFGLSVLFAFLFA